MRVFFLLLLLSASLCAEEEIVVHLDTKVQLMPLQFVPISASGSGFDKSYVSKLEKVLRFDLEHNGRTEISEKSAQKVAVKIQDKTLSATVANKRIHGVKLSGDLAKDRRIVHRVADSIHEVLFGVPGICDTRILYTVRTRNGSNSEAWISEVWEADYDGKNARQVTFHKGLCVTPTYVPATENGRCKHFAYVCYEVGQPKLYATSTVKSASARLSFMRGNQLMPAFSPKLDKVAFVCDITGNPDLFVQDFSLEEGLIGKPSQVFCSPRAAQGTPTFSPNGKRLAFVSNKDGTPRIYVLDVPSAGASMKTIHPRLISKRNRSNTCPAWSPDGTKIAYSAMTQGVRQIWLYDCVTGLETQVTEGLKHKENPAWAPDSLHLLFNASTATTSDLFMVNLHQKKAVRITRGSGEKRFPAWEPKQLRRI